MPAKKRGNKSATRKPAKARTTTKATGRSKSAFSCPDCDFVAKHAMGLGRHRSARHGVLSKRQTRRQSGGNWVTRQEAARRAGVHYNTVRQWEQAGLLRRTRKPRVRGSLVNADDLSRVLMERTSGGVQSAGAPDTTAVAAIERQFNTLIVGLERLLADARASGGAGANGRRRGRKPGPRKTSVGRGAATRSRLSAGKKKTGRGPGRPPGSKNVRTKTARAKTATRTKTAAMRRTTARSTRSGARRTKGRPRR